MLKINLRKAAGLIASIGVFASLSTSVVAEEIVARMSGHWAPRTKVQFMRKCLRMR